MGYFKTLMLSLNPFKYKHLMKHSTGYAIKFFAITLLLAILLLPILNIPKIINLQSEIYGELSKIDKTDFSGNITTSSTITFPKDEPFIKIDTNDPEPKITTEVVTINNEFIYYKPFNQITKIRFKNLLIPQNRGFLAQIITLAILLIIPALLIFMYLILFIKYMLIILIVGALIYVIFDLMHKPISAKAVTCSAFYASSFLIFLEIVLGTLAPDSLIILSDKFIPIYSISTLAYIFIVILGAKNDSSEHKEQN